MKISRDDLLGGFLAFAIIGSILFFFWDIILILLIGAIIFFVIAGAILHLVGIVSEPGSAEDPTTYKRFLKALIIFSIPLSFGLYWEWSEGAMPSTFSYIALFVWGNTAIVTLAILANKLFKKNGKK